MPNMTHPEGVHVPAPLLRVLMLEDNPRDAKLLLALLESDGYKVQSDVIDLLPSFRKHLETGEYDVILADFNLRNWTALDALEVLKSWGKDIPLIVTTGSLGDEAAVECIKQGAADFVLKDRLARLPAAVQRALVDKRLREERRQAETALRESEQRYRTLFERNLAGVFITTWDGRVLDCNQAMAKILGFESPREVRNIRVRDLYFSEQDRANFLERLEVKGSLTNFEQRLRRRDGSPVWLLGNISLTTQTAGGSPIIEGTLVDISKRRLAEAENSRLAQIVNSTEHAIFSTTREGMIATWNPGAERMFGYAAKEVKGKKVSILIPGDRQSDAAANDERLFHGEAIDHYEDENQRKDGSRIQVLLTLSPIKDATGYVTGVSAVARDITERKRAEASLRESEERFRATFENAGIGMAIVDMEGHPFKSNPILQQMLGYSEEELSRMVFTEYTHPDDRDLDWHLYGELIAGRSEKYEIEKRYLAKDGSVLWGLLTVSLVQDSHGRPVCAVAMVQDITDRKRAEEALRESEEKYRSLVSNIPDVSWTLDADSRFVFISSNIERVSGYSPDEVYRDGARLYLSSLHPDDFLKVTEGFRALFSEGRPFDVEIRARRKDGEWRWVHHRALATYEKNGVRHADGLLSDITERKRAEAEHVRLVTAIEQSAEAVVVTDPTGKIEYVNPAFTRVSGYTRDEIMGKNPRILKSDKQDPEFYRQLWETILSGQAWQGELINQRKDGSLYTEHMNIAPVRDESGRVTHFIANKQDVTAHRTLEEHVRQSAKMEAIGRLAGGVAHDFNNLLTIMNGYCELLLEQLGADAQAANYLNEVKNAGVRAASLTRQLLAFSRRQVLAPQVLDLNAVVTNLEKMLRRLIGEDIKLRTALDPLLWRVKADPGQIEQVIMNLAVNARDAMPAGGHLTLETTNVELDEAYARNHVAVKPGPHVMLAVSDTGVGMTPETKAHIFEPFFTTKEEGKGTGLGLATVYGIVKQSGGSIWVYSELGQGTVFKVYLPMVSEGLAEQTVDLNLDATSGTETIMVVEDQESVRSLIRVALESVGYKVLQTDDPESAVAICASHSGPIHLLLTDVVMPGLSGPLVAAKVTALRPDIKVVYMSGYTDDAVVHHGVLGHDVPFIQKPFSPAALRRRIREVLGRR
ncbi:MAG: PAS domain S-box protein [Terriglobia bacterium]